MSSVYSGGLMYEYTMEENNYGIVKIKGNTAQALPEYAKFKSAIPKYPAPTGDGGFTPTTTSQACPTKDADWLIDTTLLPAIPNAAKNVSAPVSIAIFEGSC